MKTERQKAINRADEWFSKFIRLKHSSNGVCFCYTTGKLYKITEVDCGHFISRANLATRWHEDNARPQGTHANRHRSGMHYEFRQRLIVDIGEDRVEKLEMLAGQNIKLMDFEIREIADHYKKKFNELVKIKGNWWK